MEDRTKKLKLSGSKQASPFSKTGKVALTPDNTSSQQRQQTAKLLTKMNSEVHNANPRSDQVYFTLGMNNYMGGDAAAAEKDIQVERISDGSYIPVEIDNRNYSPVLVPQLNIAQTNFGKKATPPSVSGKNNTRQLFTKVSAQVSEQSPVDKYGSNVIYSQGPPDQQHNLRTQAFSGSPATKTASSSIINDRVELLQPRILQSSGVSNLPAKKQVVPQRANTLAAKLKITKTGGAVFSMNSTKECTFCQPSLPHITHAQHSSCFLNSNSSIAKQRPVPTKDLIMSNLGRKYGNCHVEFENLKVVNDLIYNEQTHMVSIFKDYLILDDINEFLKRFYHGEQESQVRLPKLCEFYEKYSHVFPNFVSLPESKYMFRNIQKKQKLIDDQFNRAAKNNKNEDGNTNESQDKAKASLLNSANKLFTSGFIESVWNQNTCSALPVEDWTARRKEAQEKKYLESARRLDKTQRDRNNESKMPFQPENLSFLVQKFLHKDTESTIRMNSSLGQIGDDILGDTFRRDLSHRLSTVTVDQESVIKGEIGLIHRHSDQLHDPNRVSMITTGNNNVGSFQVASTPSTAMPVNSRKQVLNPITGKTIQQQLSATKVVAPQLKASSKKSKKSSSGQSLRKSMGLPKTSQQQTRSVQGLVVDRVSLKQKVNSQAANTIQNQLGNKQLSRQQQSLAASAQQLPLSSSQHSSRQSQNRNSNFASVHSPQHHGLAVVDEQKFLRDNYLECDLGQESSSKKKNKRQSGTIESNSQSPVEGITNPLSAQPFLSKTSMNQKTTQPGSSLGFFQQRSSDLCLGSATPTQHLYHSKQTSFKNSIVNNNKVLPQLNLIQQQVETDYYSSGKGQFLRSQTALNSIQNQKQPSLVGPPKTKTKHVSRERSPPLMQTAKNLKKNTVKSPHRKKDKRSMPRTLLNDAHTQYQTGKSSVSSAKHMSRVSPGNRMLVIQQGSKTSMAMTSATVKFPATLHDSGKPKSTQSSVEPQANQMQQANRPKFYSQTEINEAEEDYPDEEVADEIPDQDDTEDEQEHLVSDDEGHINESATSSMRDRLRPVDMLLTHGGAFQDEDSYRMQLIQGHKARAQTQLAYHVIAKAPNQNQIESQRQSSQQSQYATVATHQSNHQTRRQSQNTKTALDYGSAQQNQNSATLENNRASLTNFNNTQPSNLAGARLGLKTEMGMQPVDSILTAGQIQLQQTIQMPLTSSHAANRPNTNLIGMQQFMSTRSKFSRENSISSRQETQTRIPKQSNLNQPMSTQSSQRFKEATIKLGGKALTSTQNQASLTTSLRQSLEPSQKQKGSLQISDARQYRQKPPQSSQASINQSRPKAKQSSNSQPKNQKQQLHFKVDLTTRLANNLISDHLSKQKGSQMQASNRLSQKSGAKTATLTAQVNAQALATMHPSTIKANSKPGSFAKSTTDPQATKRLTNRQSNSNQTNTVQSSQNWKRKTVTSQSPPSAAAVQKSKKASAETLGFKAMGSGKASYLTNVGIAATANTLSSSSRNMTSPYATVVNQQYQRFTNKDISLGSLPKTKVMSRSPPISSQKDSISGLPSAANQKSQSSNNFTLQQQLQQINRQLAMNQVKTSSFRQNNAISPPSMQSQGSLKKGVKSSMAMTVLSPAAVSSHTGSLINTGEKNKQRKSLDGQISLMEVNAIKSLQRQSQQLNKLTSTQALISLPNGKTQQKNLQIQVSRAAGSKQQSKQRLAATIELNKNGVSAATNLKQSQKTSNNFIGQPRNSNHGKTSALSPLPQGNLKTQKQTKKNAGQESRTSDRSIKFTRSVVAQNNNAGSFQRNSQGEMSRGIASIEEIPTRFSDNFQQQASKKQISNHAHGKLAKK